MVMPTDWQMFRWDAVTFRRVWAALRSPSEVELELPKFRLRSRTPLGAVVDKFGVRLDDPQLQAGLLASGEPVSIDHAIHEAFIQVDETSTEAAAATAMGAIKIQEIDRGVLRLDRPFYFMLVDRKTGLITFMGQLTEPIAAG
jgi:serpin B